MSEGKEYAKGLLIGSIIGGAVGAVIALLFAPKSGKEFRQDIASKTSEFYKKASDYLTELDTRVDEKVWETVNEGKIKAQGIIESAKTQAQKILDNAERIVEQAKEKARQVQESVESKIQQVKEATKAGAEAFKQEIRNQ